MLRLGPKKIEGSPFRYINKKYLEKKKKDKKIAETIAKLTINNKRKKDRGDEDKTNSIKSKKQRRLIIPKKG